MTGEIMTDLPVACTLDEGGLKRRREGLLAQLAARVTRREWLAEGLRLEFAATSETLELIGKAIEAERRCCRFLRFQLTVEPDDRGIVLELTGPPGTAEFLQFIVPSSEF